MIKLTEKLKHNITSYYINGLQQNQIAELTGLSYKTITRFIKTSSVYKTRRELADIKLLNKRRLVQSVNKIDTQEFISLYNNGASLRNLCIKYNVGHVKLTKILTDNNVKIRTHSESLSIYKRLPLSDEHKSKIREARLKYLHLNPDKVPYRLWNRAGYISYPHNKVLTILHNMNINGWIAEYPVSIYSYDIAFPELKLDIEIDGSTHTRPESIISDARRDAYSISHGWSVLRFTASDVVKDTTKVIDSIIETITSINPSYLLNFDIEQWNIQKQNYMNYKLNSYNAKLLKRKSKLNKDTMSVCDCIVHPTRICANCFNDFIVLNDNQLCCNKSCAAKYRHKESTNNRPSIDILIDKIKSSSYVSVGKEYGVSDTAIRKWVKAYGINPKTLLSL